MAPESSSTTKIPAPAALLDPETTSLPPTTRNALLSHLQESTTIPKLNSLLTDALARNGWMERVHEQALELLRSGECTNFGEVLNEISRRACQGPDKSNGGANGSDSGAETPSIDIRIPSEVIEKSVRFLKDDIEGVIEVVYEDKNASITNGVNGLKGK